VWTKRVNKFDNKYKLYYAQRALTSGKASNLKQTWSGIRIQIFGLIRSRIAPKMLLIHYLIAGVSHFAECRENRAMIVWEMLINLLEFSIPRWWGKWKSDPESVAGTDHHQKLISSSDWYGPNHNIKFQWNRLITFAVLQVLYGAIVPAAMAFYVECFCRWTQWGWW